MENKSHALAAGAFVLAVTALLVSLAFWLTRDTSEQRIFELTSAESVTGLQSQAGVRYKGVLVGRVTSIGLDKTQPGNVLVRIAINDAAPITQSTFASLGFQGVTGLAFIALDDSGESKEPLISKDDATPRIPMRAGMIAKLSEQGMGILTQVQEASGRANQLLAAQNQKVLMEAISNMGQAAASINQLSKRANQVLGPAGSGQSMAQLSLDAGNTLKGMQATSERLGQSADAVRKSADAFKAMSTRMSEPGGTLDKIARGSDSLVATGQSLNASVVPRLSRIAEDAARTARQVGRAVDGVNDNPQSLILGRGAAVPGPGEPGFAAPAPK
jgi:phospholipid/cholesterol/gamma-HCH transport system substrate-binding protein